MARHGSSRGGGGGAPTTKTISIVSASTLPTHRVTHSTASAATASTAATSSTSTSKGKPSWTSIKSAFSRRDTVSSQATSSSTNSTVTSATATDSLFSVKTNATECTTSSSISSTSSDPSVSSVKPWGNSATTVRGAGSFWSGIGLDPTQELTLDLMSLDLLDGSLAEADDGNPPAPESKYLKAQRAQQLKYQQQLQQQQLRFFQLQLHEPEMKPDQKDSKSSSSATPAPAAAAPEKSSRKTTRPRGSARGGGGRPQTSLGNALNSPYELQQPARAFGNKLSEVLRNNSAATAAASAGAAAAASGANYGLVSRGHVNELQSSAEAREKFFDTIQTKFLQLTLSTRSSRVINYAREVTVTKSLIDEVQYVPEEVITIESILMQLRVLREAILSLAPSDFHKEVLIYSVLVSAVYGHYQTYMPSFLTLINDVLPELLETTRLEDYYREEEFQRVSTIYVYHLVHYANDCPAAFELLGQYYSPESPLYEFIGCWVDKDYFQWRREFDAEHDPALHRVMAFGELTMAKEALARVGKSYHRMECSELESVLGMDWSRIVAELKCEWTLENDVVYIRKKQ